MSTHRFAARREGATFGNQHGAWLDLIWATNALDATAFCQPDSTGPGATGEYTEEYPRFRVVHHDDETVTVSGKTPEAESLLRRAARTLPTT